MASIAANMTLSAGAVALAGGALNLTRPKNEVQNVTALKAGYFDLVFGKYKPSATAAAVAAPAAAAPAAVPKSEPKAVPKAEPKAAPADEATKPKAEKEKPKSSSSDKKGNGDKK